MKSAHLNITFGRAQFISAQHKQECSRPEPKESPTSLNQSKNSPAQARLLPKNPLKRGSLYLSPSPVAAGFQAVHPPAPAETNSSQAAHCPEAWDTPMGWARRTSPPARPPKSNPRRAGASVHRWVVVLFHLETGLKKATPKITSRIIWEGKLRSYEKVFLTPGPWSSVHDGAESTWYAN